MRLLKFYLCIMLVLVGFTSGLTSCNPVKQVLRDPKKFAQVRDSVFARGLCLNDTVKTEVIRDTTIYKEITGQADTVHLPAGTCQFDTYVKGTRVRYKDGVLTVDPKVVTRTQLKTILKTNTVRDVAKENVLKKELVDKDKTIAQIEASASERYNKLEKDLAKEKLRTAGRNTILVSLIAIVIGLTLWTFRKPLIALL